MKRQSSAEQRSRSLTETPREPSRTNLICISSGAVLDLALPIMSLGTHVESGFRRFATFEVDLRTGELRKNGSRLHLQEQPFQILAMLLENPGQLITHEQLRQKLWPSDTFVDFDHGLKVAVSKLRKALEDSASTPR